MTTGKYTKPWTKEEELILLQGVGANGLVWIMKKTGRTKKAIYAKLRDMTGNGGLTRGSFTLIKACKFTGYSACQLKRARDALKQKWKRTSKNGSYFITEDQIEECTDWLGLDYWGVKYHLYKCVWCYKKDYKHIFHGLCLKCFNQLQGIVNNLGIKRNINSIKEYVQNEYDSESIDSLMSKLDKGIMIPKKYLVSKDSIV